MCRKCLRRIFHICNLSVPISKCCSISARILSDIKDPLQKLYYLHFLALKKFEIKGFILKLTVSEFIMSVSSRSPFIDMIFAFMSIIISPIKLPTVSSRILFSIPAIANELMPSASAILSICGACETILFVSYFRIDTGCIPESLANLACVMPIRVRKYFIFFANRHSNSFLFVVCSLSL